MESETANRERKELFCEHKNPGPNYKLKSLLGHEGHCVSKVREPAFTIKGKRKEICNNTPGPGYYFDPYLTNYGRQAPRTALITGRPKAKDPEALPGPGMYDAESTRDPKGYAFGFKSESLPNLCPAPNAYTISRGIGSKSNLENPLTASIRSRTEFGNIYYAYKKAGTPGPGSYSRLDSNSGRKVTIKSRMPSKNFDTSVDNPPPGSYNVPSFVNGGGARGFSIGIKHSPYLMPVMFDATTD